MSKWSDWHALVSEGKRLRGIAADIIEAESIAAQAAETEKDKDGYEQDEYEMEVEGAEEALDLLESAYEAIGVILVAAKRR